MHSRPAVARSPSSQDAVDQFRTLAATISLSMPHVGVTERLTTSLPFLDFDIALLSFDDATPFTGWIKEQADSQVNGIEKANESDAGSHIGH